MPALPSRPSTTTARRCVASCTDRTPQRFRQAFTPAASANRGQLPRTPTALQRTVFSVVTRRVSAIGAQRLAGTEPRRPQCHPGTGFSVSENATALAAHEGPRTTKLCDRTGDEITLDEVERIAI